MTVRKLKELIKDLPDEMPVNLHVYNHTMSRGEDFSALVMHYTYGEEATRTVLGLWSSPPRRWERHTNDPQLLRELH